MPTSRRSATKSPRSSTTSPRSPIRASRLATAERARQKLADWPASHYGYRIDEVRDALDVLDEVIAQLRVAVGITRFDLSLSANAPLTEPPPPPLPPPTDAELVEQFVAAASVADSPVERISLLQTVMRLIDRAIGDDARRMGGPHAPQRQRRARPRAARPNRHTTICGPARSKRRPSWRRAGDAADLERLREKVKEEDRRLGGQRPGDVAALLATIDLQASAAMPRARRGRTGTARAPCFRRYRRSTNGAFKVFNDAANALEQVRAMTGPPVIGIGPLTKRLAAASRSFQKVRAPEELASAHADHR